MAGLMNNPGEVLNMFSDALHKLDQNTVQYMIEELEKEKQEETMRREEAEKLLKEKDRQLAELKELLEKAKKFS